MNENLRRRRTTYVKDTSIPVEDVEAQRRRRYSGNTRNNNLLQKLSDYVEEELINWEWHRWTKRGKITLGVCFTLAALCAVLPWIKHWSYDEPYGWSKCPTHLVIASWLPSGPIDLRTLPVEPTPTGNLPSLTHNVLEHQECYLKHYPFTCVHPLSYGQSYNMVSYASSTRPSSSLTQPFTEWFNAIARGPSSPHDDTPEIHHWINPILLQRGPTTIVTHETSSFWPERPPEKKIRPEWVMIEASTPREPTPKTYTVRGGAAVCLDQWLVEGGKTLTLR